MAVGKTNGLPDIHTEFIGQTGNSFAMAMLTSRYVFSINFTISALVASVLTIFALDEDRIQVSACLCGFGGHAANHARVLDQLAQDLAG